MPCVYPLYIMKTRVWKKNPKQMSTKKQVLYSYLTNPKSTARIFRKCIMCQHQYVFKEGYKHDQKESSEDDEAVGACTLLGQAAGIGLCQLAKAEIAFQWVIGANQEDRNRLYMEGGWETRSLS